ncbi:sugar phosphate isomerase/epimerase [Aliifodinibius sp. S!AR15-10]|uniref:sugar phosphate isomerase/epimerase family protein n=1 Tax=Aliifodinibius sp. S!AR15-10 TaxID=2950437 RepID=UPI0028604BCA|nr:sugar phosphate isomerase/epimerase family protein [Aliifodinibius sp. S!AR15-10]MDR8390368.1 sugar phosphate isomerase/epimerase [Aliifodinibius sp. S!AR15-10]
MKNMDRKTFLELSTSSGIGAALGRWTGFKPGARKEQRKFTMEFNPGIIGIEVDQVEAVQMAARYGFDAVYAYADFLAEISDAKRDELLGLMENNNIVWGHSGLPVDFRNDEDTFRRGIAQLPNIARGLQEAGVTRMSTWIMSSNNELHYMLNFRQHATRLREIAGILKEHGISLALEYVGPKTVWTANRYPFLHTMAETKELIAAIGQPNVGFHLDTAHWHSAGETKEDILSLSSDDVISADLNDVLAGVPREELPDTKRELPGATGVVNITEFLEALVEIGFEGPIQAEPFNEELNQMADQKAAMKTAEAMKKAFSAVRS